MSSQGAGVGWPGAPALGARAVGVRGDVRAGALNIDVTRPSELGEPELARWREIQAREPALGSPFLSPEFAVVVERARPGTRIAVLSDPAGVIGFFPFERTRLGFGRALAQGLSDVQALIAPQDAQLDLAQLIRACGLRVWEFDHLLAHQERHALSAPGWVVRERSLAVDVAGGWDAYVGGRRRVSRSLFQSTARKARKLERSHGPVRLQFDEPDHASLDLILRWKSEQYRRTGRRDRFADPAMRRLVHELLDVRADSFGAPLALLRAGDALVAGHLGLRSATQLAWWFPVYATEFAQYSPGLILVIELVRSMGAAGIPLLDLGKGEEPYKERLGNTEIELMRGAVAADPLIASADAIRRWPKERLTRLVLDSPRLRGWARWGLARVGTLRTHLHHKR